MITITNECNLELMKRYPDNYFDLLLTDPPFGMEFQSSRRKEKHLKIENDDNLVWLPKWIENIKRVMKKDAHLYIFCSFHKIEVFKNEIQKHFKVKNILIWEKNNHGSGDLFGDYAPKYEMILFCSNGEKKLNGKRNSNIIKAKKTSNENHPTEKPINLLEYLIEKSTNKKDVVLDTFGGSFSTAFACHNTDRDFVGCEINIDYYNSAIKRIQQHQSQLTIF